VHLRSRELVPAGKIDDRKPALSKGGALEKTILRCAAEGSAPSGSFPQAHRKRKRMVISGVPSGPAMLRTWSSVRGRRARGKAAPAPRPAPLFRTWVSPIDPARAPALERLQGARSL